VGSPPPVRLEAPCPCGSGRKYKRCCLAREQQNRATAARAVQRAGPELFEWARTAFPDELEACNTIYLRHADKRFGTAKVASFIARTHDMVFTNLVDAFVFEWEVQGNQTPVEVYLLDRGSQLHPRASAYLAAARRAALSLVEVEDVTPGHSILVRDLLSRRLLLVTERTASRHVARWQVMFARIAELGDENLFTGAIYPFDRDHLEWVLATLHREKDRRGYRSLSWPEFLHRRWDVVPALWFEMYVDPLAKLQLTNSDGEPLRWVKLELELAGAFASEAAARLDSMGELQRDDDGIWRWIEHKEGDEGTIVATAALEGNVLEVNVNSLEREARVRPHFEEVLRSLIVDVRRQETDIAEAMRQQATAPAEDREERHAAGGGVPPETAAPIMREVLQRHYQRWIDTPLPALDDLTPRQAAAEPAMRPRLVRLLKSIELHEREAGPSGRAIDVSFLWRELGLRRP
jgi:hypothetical protein